MLGADIDPPDPGASAADVRAAVEADCGEAVPGDPWVQLRRAICSVFESWGSRRAVAYRKHWGISDLGGTRPPEGLVFQPSATIFNVTMMLTGLLVAIAALVVHRAYGHWSVSTPIAALGLGALAVGIFPGPTGNPHAIAAMVAFFSGGFAAVLSARVVRPPFRYPLLILGVITLTALASYFTLGDANPMWELGVGGAERWVAYPEILWLMGFGGYLAGRVDGAREVEQEPRVAA